MSWLYQVDMGGLYKFTGITMQPYDDSAVSHVLTFYIQYSREGLKWENALDTSAQKKVGFRFVTLLSPLNLVGTRDVINTLFIFRHV